MTHATIPLALGLSLGPTRIARRVLVAGVVLAMLPDADVVGFALRIAYADPLGHRGASHAILVAIIVAALVGKILRPERRNRAFAFLCISMASHGLLDAFTSGGLGPALLWPLDNNRIFAPITPIRVSPIGAGFFSARAWPVLLSELIWVWLPMIGVGLIIRGWARQKEQL